MEYAGLEQNIIDVIQEEQVKLGYRREKIYLYYPLSSLNRFLKQEYNEAEMNQALEKFCDRVRSRLGNLVISHENQRFCIMIPEKGVQYVHEHLTDTEFIVDFIRTIERHGCDMEEVFEVFRKHSGHVHIEQMDHGEFDYLVYFEDGVPDKYRYCLTNEGCHIIYHRFTPEDYQDFGFQKA